MAECLGYRAATARKISQMPSKSASSARRMTSPAFIRVSPDHVCGQTQIRRDLTAMMNLGLVLAKWASPEAA